MKKPIKGTINAYSDSVRAGTILDEAQNIYMFSLKDWASPTKIEVGIRVVFFVEGNRAKSIREG